MIDWLNDWNDSSIWFVKCYTVGRVRAENIENIERDQNGL